MILDSKILKSFIPFVGTLFIIFGYLKISFFYKYFNIDIENYLEFSEILTIFLPDILKYSFFIFFGLALNFLSESKADTLKFHKLKLDISDSDSFKSRFKNHYKLNKELVIATIFILIMNIFLFFLNRERFYEISLTTMIIPAFLLFNVVLLEFRYKYKSLYGEYFNPTINNILITIFMFGLVTIFSTYSEIQKTENEINVGIEFDYSDENFKTNKTLIYLGQTRNYLFLYDKKEKESKIFERKDIHNYTITYANNL